MNKVITVTDNENVVTVEKPSVVVQVSSLRGSGGSGSVGPKGDTGAKGDKGDTGPQGIQGVKGDTGLQGEQGFKGEKGDVGATGAKGDTGTQGPVGATGPSGAGGQDFELIMNDVTTNNSSTIKHGFLPKLPNDSNKFMNGSGAWSQPFLHPRDGFRIQEQFNTVLGTTGSGWIFTANSGQHTLNSSLTANRAGVISVRTGASATSAPTVSLGSVAASSISTIPYTWECELQIGNLSTVTEEFSIRAGFGSVNTSAAFTNGLWFEYNRLASGDFWIIKTISSAASSTTNVLSVPVLADTWYIFKIVINAAGTSAEFFINGASVGVITTNIPVGTSRPVLPIMQIIKSAGTTDRIMYLSWAVVGAGVGADWV